MAKAKVAKVGEPAELALKVVVEATAETPTYYANHVEMTLNQHEVALWFARLPTKPSRLEIEEARESGELVVDPEFQILIPPTMLDGFIVALQATKERYEEISEQTRSKNDNPDS